MNCLCFFNGEERYVITLNSNAKSGPELRLLIVSHKQLIRHRLYLELGDLLRANRWIEAGQPGWGTPAERIFGWTLN
jgi:hypothetical protein